MESNMVPCNEPAQPSQPEIILLTELTESNNPNQMTRRISQNQTKGRKEKEKETETETEPKPGPVTLESTLSLNVSQWDYDC